MAPTNTLQAKCKLAAVYGESSARYPRPQGKPAHQLWSELNLSSVHDWRLKEGRRVGPVIPQAGGLAKASVHWPTARMARSTDWDFVIELRA